MAKYYCPFPVRLISAAQNADTEIYTPRQAFSVLKEAGCSDEALCYEMCVHLIIRPLQISATDVECNRWMSKEPAEIFERAAEEGFIQQVMSIPH